MLVEQIRAKIKFLRFRAQIKAKEYGKTTSLPLKLNAVQRKKKEGTPTNQLASSYPKMAFKSSSTVLMGIMLNFSTSTFSTFGVRNAGKLGPKRIFFTPK